MAACTFHNAGGTTWTAASQYHLGSQNAQDNSTWDLNRVNLPSTIAPGQDATFNFTVTAPSTAGTYNFQWRMVQDGLEWFGEYAPNVNVNVSSPSVPSDGLTSLTYDSSNNHITTAGFAYDAAGNQIRAMIPGGSSFQRFRYDAANRLVQVLADNNSTVLASYTYGDSNERLISDEDGYRTYFDCEGGVSIAEFSEVDNSATLSWSKSYVYLGARLLATMTPNGAGGNAIEFDHPDRLGTRIVTNPATGTYFEQQTLPFGTALNETPPPAASFGATNRRFTTYDRSTTTGLDYAVNRRYDSQQGRFTQVDPAGISATSLESPQTLNLYAYCSNDPINRTDPSGLGFFGFLKKVFSGISNFIAKVLTNKWVLLVAGIALGALAGLGFYLAATITTQFYLGAAITLAAMSAILIIGAFHQNFLRVVKTIGGIASTVQGIAGVINSTINGHVFGTPPWNGGTGAVSHFLGGQGLVQEPETEILRTWTWAYGWKIHALMQRIKQALCHAVPSGRTTGVQVSMGAKAGPTGGVELVQNFRTGQISGFAFGGGQVGVVGGFSGYNRAVV
ncbi:MAG: hypothetical protein DMF72_01275 [Acidobacteria bacterium]|nr:MAG: hypothetical protein DMF72_01275 [Acidobacteriota bacterium]